MQPEPKPVPATVQVQIAPQPVRWQQLTPSGGRQGPPQFEPLPNSGRTSTPVVWSPLPQSKTKKPTWVVRQGNEQPVPLNPVITAPLTAQEAEARRQALPPPSESYTPLLRLGQMPTPNFLNDGYGNLSFQQVSPGSGGAAGGTGNQNYGFRADLSINSALLLSAFYSYDDDPLYARITVRTKQPSNLWTVGGIGLRGRLSQGTSWALAAEGSLEVFTVGSGGCFSFQCTNSSDNIFNTTGQRVLNRNVVGSLSLPLRWNPVPRWQLALTPGVSFLPWNQGANQGAAGPFYGTNVSVGVGSSYRFGDQLNIFGSAVVPLGPGNNAFNNTLTFSRIPILSVGANYAINPRIGLELAMTNGFGLTPATAVLPLPSAPSQPMISGRFVWNPTAPDSPKPLYTTRQRSLGLGGVTVSTALLPPVETTQLWLNSDSLGNLLGSATYTVSNDFQFELNGGSFGSAGAAATGVPAGSSAAVFLNTYVGPGNRQLRFGGKAMVFRPTKGLPVWASGRITVGRNTQTSSYQGYLFFETINTWEATPWLAFNLNPKLAWSGKGSPWGVGLSANIQLGKSFQLIPEINAVATNLGGRNGTNGTLALRWLASDTAALDLYASNASGILDMGQLLGTGQVRVGGKLTIQF